MAKVKSAYLNEIRGTVAKRLTFRKQKLKADQTLQKIPVPSYTRTTAQDNVRRGYRRLCDIWKTADWLDKEVYANFAEKHEITTFNSFLKYNMPVMSRKPVLYLSLDEGAGTTAHDFSEFQNHGTIYGATWQKLRSGKNVLYFDGVDDKVTVHDSSSLDSITKEITIIAWIWFGGVTENDYQRVVCKARGGWKVWTVWVYNDRSVFFNITSNGTNYYITTNNRVKYRDWSFLACVFDGDLHVYVDMQKESKTVGAVGIDTNDRDVVIGNCGNGDRPFNGLIAHISIYNRALSESEIKKIYETTKVLFE